jgi:hypothetical protein
MEHVDIATCIESIYAAFVCPHCSTMEQSHLRPIGAASVYAELAASFRANYAALLYAIR